MDKQDGLRPIDLARIVGISAQQIRNYADSGILPPAPRTPTGYRTFSGRHREALLTYRSLAEGYGWDTARAVMQAVHTDDLALALSLVDAAHATAHDHRRALQDTAEALEVVAGHVAGTSPPDRSGLRIGEVAARVGVRTSALRVWEAAGLLVPEREAVTGYRSYRPVDVRDARMIRMLRQGHYSLPQIRAVLEGLRSTGNSDALRAAIAERRDALTRRAAAMLKGSCSLHHYTSTAPATSRS